MIRRAVKGGVFKTLLAGRQAGYVSPIILGEGRKDGETWTFKWDGSGGAGTASVRLHGDTIEMTLKEGRREREEITLATGAVFEDPAIRLAPLSTAAAWRRWFEVVFVGHFLAADIPGC